MGNGLNIKIWGDNWLPRENYAKVLNPRPHGFHPNLTVRSLIMNSNRMQWNESLICKMFFKEEANLILGIPLSLFDPP